MDDKERIQWLFEHFLAMETKYEAAAAELARHKAPLRFLVSEEALLRMRNKGKRKPFSPTTKGRI